MATTLTIRDVDPKVKQKLRILAATHGRSMEAEVRAILSKEVALGDTSLNAGLKKNKFKRFKGIWKRGLTTDQVMRLTRGE